MAQNVITSAGFPMNIFSPKVEQLMKSLAKVTLNDATT